MQTCLACSMRHEKIRPRGLRTKMRRTASAFAQTDQCFCYTIFEKYYIYLATGGISIFQLVSVAEETDFSLAFSDNPRNWFCRVEA